MSEFEGSGIGMATAKKIVELHGGAICAPAREGHGATFRVTLTLEDQHNGSAVSAV
jgi:signal transduction histidine kinase